MVIYHNSLLIFTCQHDELNLYVTLHLEVKLNLWRRIQNLIENTIHLSCRSIPNLLEVVGIDSYMTLSKARGNSMISSKMTSEYL